MLKIAITLEEKAYAKREGVFIEVLKKRKKER
jgi:hypothetical protein